MNGNPSDIHISNSWLAAKHAQLQVLNTFNKRFLRSGLSVFTYQNTFEVKEVYKTHGVTLFNETQINANTMHRYSFIVHVMPSHIKEGRTNIETSYKVISRILHIYIRIRSQYIDSNTFQIKLNPIKLTDLD